MPGPIDLKLYVVDQFQNLVGDQPASITDDTPVARVDAEAGADTDFVNDNPTARASSSRAVTQTVDGSDPADKALVDTNGDPVSDCQLRDGHRDSCHRVGRGRHESRTSPSGPVTATLFANNKGANIDRLKIKTNPKVPNAQVRLYKKVGKRTILIGAKRANDRGVKIFLKPDRNGGRFTKYFAVVAKTQTTQRDRTNNVNLR